MPYIGRNHIAGDHTSNFKVLDDISSYTATFNGSSALIVSTTDNTIRIPEHRFIQGQRVTYSNGGGGNIGGLTNGTAYFVTFDTANTFKLATSLANANNNTNINLSSVGTGSAHTLTAAFDGVNTTFKITHGGGSSADIVNSAQLQIAINNVIQKANLDSSYTEGFFVVDSRKIQFKTAPTANDIFWGNIIANTIETFDIADLKVDNFTGDGTTTQFTLSRSVPNNESIMVTIDGVLQHPSDKDTTRAYRVLSESVIEFSSPPPNHGNIQVRHLGFAGASTGEVSGFYGRTGNVVLGASDHITTGDITPRNINASGIVTASSFVGNLTGNVSGNLTVGGVLTYEDVTNVDSIGIITARSDVHVGAGLSVVGVSTFSDNLKIIDDKKIIVGNGLPGVNDLEIFHQSSNNYNYIKSPARGFIIQNSGNSATYIAANYFNLTNANFSQTYATANNYGINLRYNNDQKLRTASSGIQVIGVTTTTGLAVTGVSTFTGNIDANGDLDVDGHTNLDNVNIAGVTTATSLELSSTNPTLTFTDTNHNSDFHIENADGSFEIRDVTNGADRIRIASDGTIDLLSNINVSGEVTIPTFLVHAGDTNTKFGFEGPDTITFYTAGAERLRIGSAGQIGIAGANYGSSGQVLTSGGSGASVSWSTITGTTINNNANNRVITGSGTANTLEGEANLTFDGAELDLNNSGGSARLYLVSGNSADSSIYFGRQNDGATGGIRYEHTNDSLQFMGYNNSERLRIDSAGKLLLGDGSFNNNSNGFKMSIKESSNENAAIMFLDTDNMKGGICGIAKGTNQIITGTTNVDFVLGSVYADTHIIYGTPSNQVGAIGMTLKADTGHIVIEEGLGIGGVDPGGSTLKVNGSLNLSQGGNTSWQKVTIEGSNNTAGDALSINNWGDAEGDYWGLMVNQTMNQSGNFSKTNSGKRTSYINLDGRMGRVYLGGSGTGTNPTDHFYTNWDGTVYMNSGFGSVAPFYGVRAWVQGNSGTTNGSGGLSSMSRVSTGKYRLNFATTMPDDNYATGCLANNNYDDTSWHGNTETTSVDVHFYTGSSYVDPSEWSAWVIR